MSFDFSTIMIIFKGKVDGGVGGGNGSRTQMLL